MPDDVDVGDQDVIVESIPGLNILASEDDDLVAKLREVMTETGMPQHEAHELLQENDFNVSESLLARFYPGGVHTAGAWRGGVSRRWVAGRSTSIRYVYRLQEACVQPLHPEYSNYVVFDCTVTRHLRYLRPNRPHRSDGDGARVESGFRKFQDEWRLGKNELESEFCELESEFGERSRT